MARASIYTHLSIDRWARILGVAPPNFNGANTIPYFPYSGCQDLWYQYGWQNGDRISREELAQAIKSAEDDIGKAIGFPVAPTWIAAEPQPYPRHYRPEVYQGIYNIRDQYLSLRANWRKTISGGRRGLTLVSAGVAVTYTDGDTDSLFETATVTVATTQTSAQEVKVYYAGHSGDPQWEIRPCRTKVITGGVFTATFYTWQMIDPDLAEAYPTTDPPEPVDITGNPPGNVVATVDVYREYNDTTQVACQFIWEPLPTTGWCSLSYLSSNTSFGHTAQDGFLLVRDPELGHVEPMVATYDATNGWVTDELSTCREPDMVKLWYQAGNRSQEYMQGTSFDPLGDDFALWIAMVATARLERTVCSCDCGNTATLFERWREDVSISEGGRNHYIEFNSDPFLLGTHRGEVEVWKKLKRFLPTLSGAAL